MRIHIIYMNLASLFLTITVNKITFNDLIIAPFPLTLSFAPHIQIFLNNVFFVFWRKKNIRQECLEREITDNIAVEHKKRFIILLTISFYFYIQNILWHYFHLHSGLRKVSLNFKIQSRLFKTGIWICLLSKFLNFLFRVFVW